MFGTVVMKELPSLGYIKAKAKLLQAVFCGEYSHCKCLEEVVKPYGFKSYAAYMSEIKKLELI